MNPLVSETATASITPAIILMETPYVEPRPHDDIIATDDIKQTGKRSLLERRRKRWNRYAAR